MLFKINLIYNGTEMKNRINMYSVCPTLKIWFVVLEFIPLIQNLLWKLPTFDWSVIPNFYLDIKIHFNWLKYKNDISLKTAQKGKYEYLNCNRGVICFFLKNKSKNIYI